MAAKAQAWAFVLLAGLFVCGSNGERSFLSTRAAVEEEEDPGIVSPRYRTAYHFQAAKNWINGTSLCFFSGLHLCFLGFVDNRRV